MKKLLALIVAIAPASVLAGTIGPDPTPIPEPGMWGLLGVAVVALAISRFRKK